MNHEHIQTPELNPDPTMRTTDILVDDNYLGHQGSPYEAKRNAGTSFTTRCIVPPNPALRLRFMRATSLKGQRISNRLKFNMFRLAATSVQTFLIVP